MVGCCTPALYRTGPIPERRAVRQFGRPAVGPSDLRTSDLRTSLYPPQPHRRDREEQACDLRRLRVHGLVPIRFSSTLNAGIRQLYF
jgi:hypothetical protein